MIDSYKVGLKIATYRKSLNMSQEELANSVYVTRQALSKWENGTSFPSIDLLLELTKIFKISFEELLCLNDESSDDIDENDIFLGHDRNYIIQKILSNNLEINIPDVFYQFSPFERMTILKAIKEEKISCNIEELMIKLTNSEKKYLGGNNNEI